MTVIIKICGLRTIEHCDCAIAAGADMIGFVFAPSRRQIAPAQAAALITSLRATHAQLPLLVGLFVNEQPARMAAIVEQCALDAIQLSGDEPVEIVAALPELPILKAVRLAGDQREQAWLDTTAAHVTLLVETHQPGSYGGTGMVGDWGKAALLARERPIMLAGGLRPDNVAEAIRHVRPWAVDVSSGIELDGQKDCGMIARFIAAVRTVGQE